MDYETENQIQNHRTFNYYQPNRVRDEKKKERDPQLADQTTDIKHQTRPTTNQPWGKILNSPIDLTE